MAVPARVAVGLVECGLHHVGGHQRRVQTDRPGRSGAPLGREEIKTQHELRQTQPGTPVSAHIHKYREYSVVSYDMELIRSYHIDMMQQPAA